MEITTHVLWPTPLCQCAYACLTLAQRVVCSSYCWTCDVINWGYLPYLLIVVSQPHVFYTLIRGDAFAKIEMMTFYFQRFQRLCIVCSQVWAFIFVNVRALLFGYKLKCWFSIPKFIQLNKLFQTRISTLTLLCTASKCNANGSTQNNNDIWKKILTPGMPHSHSLSS